MLGLIAATHVAERLVLELSREADLEVGELCSQAVAYLGLSEDDNHDLHVLPEA